MSTIHSHFDTSSKLSDQEKLQDNPLILYIGRCYRCAGLKHRSIFPCMLRTQGAGGELLLFHAVDKGRCFLIFLK